MWVDDYIRLKFPSNPKDIRIHDAQMLKSNYIPSALFRYRQFNDTSIDNLKNEREWQSYPCEFNDPSDSRFRIDIQAIKKKWMIDRVLKNGIRRKFAFTEEEINDIHSSPDPFYTLGKYVVKFDSNLQGREEEFANIVSEVIDKELGVMNKAFSTFIQKGFLIVCFSEVNDSNLMWSHYSNSHTGFCVEYNFKEVGSQSIYANMLNPVVYSDQLFDATQYLIDPLIAGHEHNYLFGTYTAISKGVEWKYEREWRTIFPLGPNAEKKYRFLKVPTPKALYVGTKASTASIDLIREIAVKKEIPLYQMILDENSYSLKAHLLST